MALIITMMLCYIYGFYMFMYFPTDMFDPLYDCETLWGCVKFNAGEKLHYRSEQK